MRILVAALMPLAMSAQQLLQPTITSTRNPSIEEARSVLLQVQTAIQKGDDRRLAAMILFPLGVQKGKLAPTFVPSVQVFLRTHVLVFTKRIRAAILAQNPDVLALRGNVVPIGGGVAVIGKRCDPVDRPPCSTGVMMVRLVDDPSVP